MPPGKELSMTLLCSTQLWSVGVMEYCVSRRCTALSLKRCGSKYEPNPTCAGPFPYRSRCPNSDFIGGTQPGRPNNGSSRRGQAAILWGVPRFGLHGALTSDTGRSAGGYYIPLQLGKAVTLIGPWGCLVTSPGENGTVY